MTSTRIPGLICALVLCGIMAAGLLPFRRPRNAVTWLGTENGIRFGKYGTVWSSGEFHAFAGTDEASCSLEIWLQPGLANASSTILAFYTPENSLRFSVHQYHGLLILNRESGDDPGATQVIGINDVFRPARSAFITITSGAQKTALYVDGNLAKSFPLFRMGGDCTGQLVVGTSAVANNSWTGELRGLAIYARELSAVEVLRHYESWTTQGRPGNTGDERAMGVYLFDERIGNTAHDDAHRGIDLNIPPRFSLLHQKFLEPFWKEYRPRRSYFLDILVNIAGFIPLGVVFFAYWSSARPIRRAALATVALGLAVSLTIEILQSHLPTRDSGTTDLITNTFGTFLGVKLCALKSVRSLLARVHLMRTAA